MAEYIEREEVIEACTFVHGRFDDKYISDTAVKAIPTADVVKVVRCKDCKYRVVNEHYGEKGYMRLKAFCDLDTGDLFELGRNAEWDDWFCADGERREE